MESEAELRPQDAPFAPEGAIVKAEDGTFSSTLFEIRCHQELMRSVDLADMMGRVLKFIQRLGFTDFSVTRMASKDPEGAMIMGTTPLAMAIHYGHKNVWEHDLMLQYAAVQTEPLYQTTVDKYIASAPFLSETIRSNRETREYIKGFGYQEYYNIPLKAANGNGNVLIAVTAKNLSPEQIHQLASRSKVELQIIARAIDHIGTRRFPKWFLGASESQEILISPRPLQLLTTMAKGNMTLNEAAAHLNMAISTANQHIAAIRNALDANSTVAALYRAIKADLID
jgi:DNA-binding CsgD family transcriptional regulator